MAERRMFAKTIIDSDAFLDMPSSSQLLYFHLCMRADDEGFINKSKSIMRLIGCKDDDLKLLFIKNFVIPFESGVVVIKHWKIHNYIRSDRMKETVYRKEKEQLGLKANETYTLSKSAKDIKPLSDICPSSDGQMSGSCPSLDRIGKDSIGKGSIGKVNNIAASGTFTAPTVEEVRAYCEERSNRVDAERFVDFYSSKGWMVGKNRMKDWRASVRNWEKNANISTSKRGRGKTGERTFSADEFEKSLMSKYAEEA